MVDEERDVAKNKGRIESTMANQSTLSASDQNRITHSSDTVTEAANFVQLLTECLALGLVYFLVWLDEGILATVIPSISNHFQSLSVLAWYAPSYLFGLCAFQLPSERVYKDFPTRPTFPMSLFVFEVASIKQAAAPNSAAFVTGRVIAGIGGSGVLTGALAILSREIPKSKLPSVMGSFSWLHGVCGITGPLIGGADFHGDGERHSVKLYVCKLNHSRSFYINPLILIASICPMLLLRRKLFQVQAQSKSEGPSFLKLLMDLDYLDVITIVPCVVSLLLALQLGGSISFWSDARSIVPLVLPVILLGTLLHSQSWKGDEAVLPPRIAKPRVVFISAIYSGSLDAIYLVMIYYVSADVNLNVVIYSRFPLWLG